MNSFQRLLSSSLALLHKRTFVGGKRISDKMLSNLYADNWIVRKFVDVRTTDMTRLDREILTQFETEELKRLESAGRRTGAFKAREEVLKLDPILLEKATKSDPLGIVRN